MTTEKAVNQNGGDTLEEANQDHNNIDHDDHEDPNQKNAKNKSMRGGGEDHDDGTGLSVEQMFENQEVPSWRKQLTVRAFVVSFALSILFSFIVMKFSLTVGVVPSLNVSAGLLGFFFVKTWTKLVERSGMLKQPFTRQENTVIQTCVVASSGLAFSGGFGSYLFGMSESAAKQSSDTSDFKNPALGWMIGFLFVVSFLGLFSLVPLRKPGGGDMDDDRHRSDVATSEHKWHCSVTSKDKEHEQRKIERATVR
ncbi:putative metal-nicotianamine transporter YSL5 [Morus notabilis]|uniref:Putative metal-nicotianamine transporter YSL5 n=1 Tax=Morus notabilis TaxID=981085 RepID=W9SE46_9ROSA|nr:putative metal-nicotianamine transporter YSL5 [Morus notabilis]